jgi:hypothetical protein
MPTYQIQIRRGTAADWTSANPTLADGEFGYETDSRRLKVGNGSSNWASLAYADAGPPQVVSSGAIANLTSPQQSSITTGTVVTTQDGRRWVYSGSGSKTSEASYVELADITPDWSVIANKPSTFTPADGSVTDAKIDAAGLSASSINWTGVTAWAASTAYSKGALVHYLGITYRRSVAGTSGATFNTANWQQMTAPINVTVTPAALSANTNDYALAITSGDIFRISSSAAVNITGITAGLFDGHAILLRNVGSFTITLKHQDTGSTAANRILSAWSGDTVLVANASALLIYDATTARWAVT